MTARLAGYEVYSWCVVGKGGAAWGWSGMGWSGENSEIPKRGTPQRISGQFSFPKWPLLPAPRTVSLRWVFMEPLGDHLKIQGPAPLFYFIYLSLKFLNFFIFGCVGSSFLCEAFLQLRQAGASLHRGARASHYRGLSCCGAQAPDAQAQ